MPTLNTQPIRDNDDLVSHFDRSAAAYREAHGNGARLLDYRLSLIRRFCDDRQGGVLLEIGCGTAIHLCALANSFVQTIGTDISPEMIRAAGKTLQASGAADRISLRVDPAENLGTIEDASIDVVLCVGAIEHMLDRSKVARQVTRVLKPGGIFVCMTPNGGYWWYTFLAPCLRIATRHLSTDRFLRRDDAAELLRSAGLRLTQCDYWTFIPKGDMPGWIATLLKAFDWLGRGFRLGWWRGGLILRAMKRA